MITTVKILLFYFFCAMSLNKPEFRTRGDGMENDQCKSKRENLIDKLIFRPSESCYLRPIVPKGRIFTLVPKYVPKKSKKSFLKTKEPKFVPYEPYKAAIKPIITKKNVIKESKNNVDIQNLVTQMSVIAQSEFQKAEKTALEKNEPLILRSQWKNEKLKFETDIKNLRETNTHLENQLKFQAQVNSELKTLLVAAVGEDLETRVQHLTEDKLSLARELLKSANHLTSHQEHTEWLSGQCEVWRSKFLASSLMVEELSRWKSALSRRISEFEGILKRILEEHSRIHENSLKTYHSLNLINEHLPSLHKSADFYDHIILKSTNITDLSTVNLKLTENIENNLLKDLPLPRKHHILEGNCYTSGEMNAIYLLKNPVVINDKNDICNAVMGAASSIGGGQLFLQHPDMKATCCAHCKGDVENI